MPNILKVVSTSETMNIRQYTLSDVLEKLDGPIYMTGMDALVRSALVHQKQRRVDGLTVAGYVTGYRGSPLGGVDAAFHRARKQLSAMNVQFQPGLNEDLAATAIWGTQQVGLYEKAKFDGVLGVWYGKGPGVDRSGDAFKHGNLAGTSANGGVVVLAGDDHMCKSSTTAHQSEPLLTACGIPILNPAGVEELVPYFLMAAAMSRYTGCWVSMKCLADTMDSSTSVDIIRTNRIVTPPDFMLPAGGLNIRRADTPVQQERRLVDFKIPAAAAFARANRLDRVTFSPERKRLGIVTCGKSWLDVQTALRLAGLTETRCGQLGIGLYKIGLVWPLESEGARSFAAGYDEILIVEEKRPLVEDQFRTALYSMDAEKRPVITGKTDPGGRTLLASHGELDPASIARVIVARLRALDVLDDDLSLPEVKQSAGQEMGERRSPWFCAGCPHNISTRLPDGSIAGAGIGCHGLAMFNDAEITLPFTQMGGEGANWIGRAPFVESAHIFQNLGDGTYNHSGLLAIRAAVAAGVNITYKILFNDAVAMTGGQQHEGNLSVASIVRQVDAEGVAQVAVVAEEPERHHGAPFRPGVALYHRDELEMVQRTFRDIPGVTVIIYDQACATERRRKRKRGLSPKPNIAVHINDLVCEGCGDCGAASNCVAIQPLPTPLGTKRQIDQSMCNVDMSCLKGFCPSFVTAEGVATPGARISPNIPRLPDIPAPDFAASAAMPYTVLLTGIGGTGIVTISAMLGMAAHLDRLDVRVVDQTGMAQKNGSVTSHVIISQPGECVLPSRIAPQGTNLLLGCDMLGASIPETLALTLAGQTIAIINGNVTTTGRFTRSPDLDLGVEINKRRLEGYLGLKSVSYVDAGRLATDLFGDSTLTNMIMLGYAWQKGLIPLSFEAIARAIELNGIAVDLNKTAFGWGRASAAGFRPATQAAPFKVEDTPVYGKRGATVADLRRRLVDYQNEAYAENFEAFVRKVAATEKQRLGAEGVLTLAVAQSLYKLMAYKDEYEVARLLSENAQLDRIRSLYAPGVKLGFHLAPPILARVDPRTGRPAKMKLGEWLLPILKMLALAKGLRGTALDPFGYTPERRRERGMAPRYRDLVESLLPRLTQSNADIVLAIARLPQAIRGYGHVKEKTIENAGAEQARLLAQLDASTIACPRPLTAN